MIAYCPMIKPAQCGLTGTDHSIKVTETTKATISLVGDSKL